VARAFDVDIGLAQREGIDLGGAETKGICVRLEVSPRDLVGRRARGVLLRVCDDAHGRAIVPLHLRHPLQDGEVVAGEACRARAELDHGDLLVAA
jgi:hypothetical protein